MQTKLWKNSDDIIIDLTEQKELLKYPRAQNDNLNMNKLDEIGKFLKPI